MSSVTKDLGPVTAYAYAVAGGYEGTEAEFTQLVSSLRDGQEMIAEGFDSTKNYLIGEYCIYTGNLYRFTSNHSAGAWNSSHVSQVVLGDEVSELKSEMMADVHQSANIFNKNNIINGYFLQNTVGHESASANSNYSYCPELIPVKQWDKINATNGSTVFISWYDINALPITQNMSTAYTMNPTNGYQVQVEKEEIKYIKISLKTSDYDVNTFMVNIGNDLLAYEEYGKRLSDDIRIKAVEDLTPDYNAHGIYESNILYYDKNAGDTRYSVYGDANKCVSWVTPNSLSGVWISVRCLNVNDIGTCVVVNFANNTIGYAKPLASYEDSTTYTMIKTYTIPFTLTVGHRYSMDDRIVGDLQTVTLYDTYTMQKFVLSRHTPNGKRDSTGYLNGRVSNTTALTLHNVKSYFLQPKNPKVLFIGDSFTNGFYPYRYASIVKRKLKGNAWIEGKTGEGSSTIFPYLRDYVLEWIKPKYVFWAVGTNDTDYDTWLTNVQAFISLCETNDIIPVLCTTTLRGGGSSADNAHNTMAASVNAWIKNSGYRYADLNVITTTNYDGVTQNTSMFEEDLTHPTKETFALMAEKIETDVPELFDD